jgi:ribosome-binding ATPase YchF (GTP1/OBG family)
MRVGIVGLPNAGKSSLFNALTRAGAQAANYPFTTVEPNVAVVGVPDDRLERVAETIEATPIVHETIAFHDIAGLVRGAHQGEGLGNQFLGNIRETDAIVHVVRAHGDAQVVHPDGRAEERWLREVVDALHAGRPVRSVPSPADAPGAATRLSALTSKPVLYVANVAEGDPLEPPPALREHAERAGARATAVSARLDSELGELDDEEAAAMRDELGVEESGLATVVREAYALLDLISFFTAGRAKEARARSVRRGTRARQAAGEVHTDMARGFVAAEVVSWDALVDAGGYNEARERAQLRVEGRDYELRDGDVVTFRFTP